MAIGFRNEFLATFRVFLPNESKNEFRQTWCMMQGSLEPMPTYVKISFSFTKKKKGKVKARAYFARN